MLPDREVAALDPDRARRVGGIPITETHVAAFEAWLAQLSPTSSILTCEQDEKVSAPSSPFSAGPVVAMPPAADRSRTVTEGQPVKRNTASWPGALMLVPGPHPESVRWPLFASATVLEAS